MLRDRIPFLKKRALRISGCHLRLLGPLSFSRGFFFQTLLFQLTCAVGSRAPLPDVISVSQMLVSIKNAVAGVRGEVPSLELHSSSPPPAVLKPLK